LMVPVKAIDSQRVRGNFSEHAGNYDSYASVQKRVVELLCGTLQDNLFFEGTLLDVGTGTGALTAALQERSQGQKFVVMDIAHGMTQAATQRLTGCTACDGDARLLPFADGAFAGVVSSSVYQWVDCLPSAFAEVVRVLKPGGAFAVALFGERTLYELRTSHRKAMSEQKSNQLSHVQDFPSQKEVAQAIADSGMSCQLLSSTMEVEYHLDVPDLLRQLKQIGASNASADRPKGLASRKVMQSMVALYEEAYLCAAGLPASYEVIIAIAKKKMA
nr:methyltransferase domain-containing protein [Gammaproteobacteria bacterium]NIR96372.1 methyltransferase domain-containing protein [Gammaproteobacteria bacterium]